MPLIASFVFWSVLFTLFVMDSTPNGKWSGMLGKVNAYFSSFPFRQNDRSLIILSSKFLWFICFWEPKIYTKYSESTRFFVNVWLYYIVTMHKYSRIFGYSENSIFCREIFRLDKYESSIYINTVTSAVNVCDT